MNSLLKRNQHSTALLIADVPTVENQYECIDTRNNMNISDTVQHPKIKKKKIMHKSTLHFKNQELSPRKRKMQRQIKTLKAKLRRRDKKLLSLHDLLKQLR